MTWKVSGSGKPKALAERLALQFAAIHPEAMHEMEISLQEDVAALISNMLADFPENQAVTIDCRGNCFQNNLDENVLSLKISVQPLYNFVE